MTTWFFYVFQNGIDLGITLGGRSDKVSNTYLKFDTSDLSDSRVKIDVFPFEIAQMTLKK